MSAERMTMRSLGASGLEVSRVTLGVGSIGGVGSDPSTWAGESRDAEAFALLDAAVERGVTFFDTANSYGAGANEAMLGRWLDSRGAAIRDRVVVCTKVGQPSSAGGHGSLSRRAIVREAEASLSRLGGDALDLYLVHHLDRSVSLEEVWSTFDDLVRSGLVRHIGICNVPAWLAAHLVGLCVRNDWQRPAVVQASFSLLHPYDLRDYPAASGALRFGYAAHSPLAGGWLTGAYASDDHYPEGSRMARRPGPYRHLATEATFVAIDRLRDVAERYEVSPATMALAWLFSHEFVDTVLTGADRIAHLDDAVRAMHLNVSGEDLDELNDAFRTIGHDYSSLGGITKWS